MDTTHSLRHVLEPDRWCLETHLPWARWFCPNGEAWFPCDIDERTGVVGHSRRVAVDEPAVEECHGSGVE